MPALDQHHRYAVWRQMEASRASGGVGGDPTFVLLEMPEGLLKMPEGLLSFPIPNRALMNEDGDFILNDHGNFIVIPDFVEM